MTEDQETRRRAYTVPAPGSPAQTLLEIKRSEFIGLVARASSEEQARAFVEETRRRYHDARHVCSAFVIGADREIQRSSDDGEPAGTAGIPMLQALLAHRTDPTDDSVADLADACAVVVRYFGGIKLGAGGLVRAYSDAVVQTLDSARLLHRARWRQGAIAVPHAEAGRLENELRALGWMLSETDYGEDAAVLHPAVPDGAKTLHEAEERLAALTGGSRKIRWTGTTWIDAPLAGGSI